MPMLPETAEPGRADDGHPDDALVEVVFEAGDWAEAGLAPLAERSARAALTRLGLKPEEWEIALLATDDAGIAPLNSRFRGKDGATNVLSWPAFDLRPTEPGEMPPPPPDPEQGPFADERESLGDVALALETCRREAEAAGRPLGDHLAHLVVHGCLHLLGFDHETGPDAALMERIEVEVLASMGIPDPYCAMPEGPVFLDRTDGK